MVVTELTNDLEIVAQALQIGDSDDALQMLNEIIADLQKYTVLV